MGLPGDDQACSGELRADDGKGVERDVLDAAVAQRADDGGMIVHEMVHVVQSYKHYNDTDAPGWLVEGIADYVRWFFYEPLSVHPHPKAADADARKSYRVTAAFLFWASNRYDADLVPKLNAALQANTYTEGLFNDLTGKTLDDLNAEWKASISQ